MTTLRIEVTDTPAEADAAHIVAQTRAYNRGYTPRDVRTLCVFARADDDCLIGGLTAITYWQFLEVDYLWVDQDHRRSGHGARLMAAAEAEALQRGCRQALVDTFSFQALGFYQALGYQEFGRLAGFCGQYDRHYLRKVLLAGPTGPSGN